MRRSCLLLPLLLTLAPAAAATPLPIDPRDLDTGVAACSNFYLHANGGWVQRTPVPAGESSIGRLDRMAERHRQRQLALINELGTDPARHGEPLADFIASGLDEAAIATVGLGQLGPLFAELDKISKPASQVPPLISALQARGLPLVFGVDVATIDDKQVAVVTAGGLGLPDRDYYLREDNDARELLGRYRVYVEKILSLIGSADPATEAAWVLDAEMRFARGWPASGQPPAEPVLLGLRELGKRYPALDWRGWIKTHQLQRQNRIAIADPAFFSEVNALIGSAHAVQWRAYLRFRLAHLMAPFLGPEFVAVHDDLFQRALRGRTEPLSRAERVLEATDRVLAAAFDQAVLDRYLPPASRRAADDMITTLRGTLDQELADADWLPASARPAARERLAMLSVELAQPSSQPLPTGLSFERGRYAANVLSAAASLQQQRLATLTSRTAPPPAPRATPPMAAQYDPRSNKLQVGVAVLQPPLFQPDTDPALSWGGLGALLGHELMHGFDLAGAAWAGQTPEPERIEAYRQHTAPLVEQFGALQMLGTSVDGERTLPENAADLGGLQLAWRAFDAAAERSPSELGGYTPDQRFFVGWAQLWRRNYRDDELRRVLDDEMQPPAEFRVNVPLMHVAAFGDAFGCKAGQPMWLEPDKRVRMFD